jgi:hypothetical protein
MGRMLPLFTAISLSMATTLQAETLEMPTESAAPASAPAPAATGYAVTLPGRGMNMTQVEEKFGPPLEKLPEVGDPPISRWEYSNFTVYFEYEFVINSILNSTAGKPAPESIKAVVPAETMLSEEPMSLEEPMASAEDMPPTEPMPAEIPSPFEGVEIITDPEEAMPMPAAEVEAPVPVIDEEGVVIIPDVAP